MKSVLISALALLATVLSLGATSQDSYDTYLPGAIVTLAVQVEAPAEWALNPDVPLRIKIDPQAIKQYDLKVKPTIDFKMPGHDETFVAQVPVKISAKQAAGALEIPLGVECGICTTDQSRCTFVDQSVHVNLKIAGKGGPSGSDAPAKKGRYLSHCALLPPE